MDFLLRLRYYEEEVFNRFEPHQKMNVCEGTDG